MVFAGLLMLANMCLTVRCQKQDFHIAIWRQQKPKPAQLAGIDIMIFDLQDVGARFIPISPLYII
jgi:uncharacterized protein YbbC (DUF1343 family)